MTPNTAPDFEDIVRDVAERVADWPVTAAEVDSFLEGPEPLDDPIDLESVIADATARLRVAWAQPPAKPTLIKPAMLFPDFESESAVTPKRLDLTDIVFDAFRESHHDSSIDLVIADPIRNLAFVQACWRLNARATAAEFNWILLNARKSGRIGSVAQVKRFQPDNSRLNRCSFATEWALRYMQDQAYFKEQRGVSLDLILCDPKLAESFESIARRLAPGFDSVEYRWAALRCRKNLKRYNSTAREWDSLFDYLGPTTQIRTESIPACPGLLWLKQDGCDVYYAAATNLREQVEQMLEVPEAHGRVVPNWLHEQTCAATEIAVSPGRELSVAAREADRAWFVSERRPRHNLFRQQEGALAACG